MKTGQRVGTNAGTGQGEGTGIRHVGITCVLQTQFSSSSRYVVGFARTDRYTGELRHHFLKQLFLITQIPYIS